MDDANRPRRLRPGRSSSGTLEDRRDGVGEALLPGARHQRFAREVSILLLGDLPILLELDFELVVEDLPIPIRIEGAPLAHQRAAVLADPEKSAPARVGECTSTTLALVMAARARDTCVIAGDADDLQDGIAPFEAVLDETIVRAITPTDGVEDLQTLLRACAPRRA